MEETDFKQTKNKNLANRHLKPINVENEGKVNLMGLSDMLI